MSQLNYKFVWQPNHPLAHKRGIVREHRVILYEKIGDGIHKCHWCGKEIEWQTLTNIQSDSLVPDHLDGNPQNNDPCNLVPSCNSCNSKRDTRIKEDEVWVLDSQGRKNRGKHNYCKYCGNKYIAFASKSQQNKGQHYCSKKCFLADIKCVEYEKICLCCGEHFKAKASNIKRGRGKYCSRDCYFVGRKLMKGVHENFSTL